jgi:hypothetical protein
MKRDGSFVSYFVAWVIGRNINRKPSDPDEIRRAARAERKYIDMTIYA